MKKTISILVCIVAVACFTSGCLVINVEKHEPAEHGHDHDAKEINVDEAAKTTESK